MTRRLPRGGVVKTSDGIFVSSDGIFFPSDGIFVPSAVMPASIPLALQKYDNDATRWTEMDVFGRFWTEMDGNGRFWTFLDVFGRKTL